VTTVTVLRAVYDDPLDITGVDLISVLSRSKDALPAALGTLALPAEMEPVALPVAKASGGNGVVADELHTWPWAIQGRRMGLEIRITDGMVMGARFGTTHVEG